MEAVLEQALNYFQSSITPSGQSLYDILESVVHDALNSKSDVDIESLVLKAILENSSQTSPQEVTSPQPSSNELSSLFTVLSNSKNLPAVRQDSSLIRAHSNMFSLPSLTSSFSFLRCNYGIGLSDKTTFLLTSSLYSLASALKVPPSDVVYVGSFFTLSSPYHCIEIHSKHFSSSCLPALYDAQPGEFPAEQWGEGTNEVVVMVIREDEMINNGGWVMLPATIPKYLSKEATKYACRFLTGDLSTRLAFFDSEAHYLRSIIASLRHSTVISPSGVFQLNEEDDQIVEITEDYDLSEVKEAENVLESWVHLLPHIMDQGRTKYTTPIPLPKPEKEVREDDEESEEEEEEGEEEEPESKELLSSCSNDVDSWMVKSFNYLKSIKYPGASVFFMDDQWGSIYFGYGLTQRNSNYSPISPGLLSVIPVAPEENPDPTVEQEQNFIDEQREKREEEEEEEEEED
ncbi:hypothetical protein RCL1_005824 [Eukaryota sp. TZLM3-RCL]